MTSAIWLLKIPFDVLDAAVYECLPGNVAGWVDFNRENLTYGSVIYKISQYQLGDLGTIILRKSNNTSSVLELSTPPRPLPIHPSQKEWDAQNFSAISDMLERFKRKSEFLAKFSKEADVLFQKRKEHQQNVISVLFEKLKDDLAVEYYFEADYQPDFTQQAKIISIDNVRQELKNFKSFIERQLFPDIFDKNGKPLESTARGLLQAFLTSRSYREIPVGGGKTDLLIHLENGRVLFETKIWRGKSYHEQGLREIAEYIKGENDDAQLLGTFYVVFDDTKEHRATTVIGNEFSSNLVNHQIIETIIINLIPKTPSKA